MDDIQTYQIEVRGSLDEKDLINVSPLQMELVRNEAEPSRAATLMKVRTDQSGLIGLLRLLHGRGIILFSVQRER